MSQTDDRLVQMANQIAMAFKYQEPEKAAAATHDHIWHFWDPRMRARVIDLYSKGRMGFSDIAFAAIEKLVVGAKPSPVTRATDFSAPEDGEAASDAG